MEDKLEQLLNSLIEKGWKPFGKIPVDINQWCSWETYCKYFDKRCIHIHREDDIEYDEEDEDIRNPRRTDEFSLRELASKESGLWQFVCLNRLWKDIDEEKYWHKKTPKMSELRSYDYHFEEYRLIESSLKDESELEQFLLDNIKV